MKVRTMLFILPGLLFLIMGQASPGNGSIEGVSNPFPVKTDLLALKQQIKVIPEDEKIGPLERDGMVTEDEKQILKTVLEPFFSSLIGGTLNKKLLLTDNIIPLERDLTETILKKDLEPQFYRIGVLSIKGDSAVASCRIKGKMIDYTGTVFIKKITTGWVVEDIEIGISP